MKLYKSISGLVMGLIFLCSCTFPGQEGEKETARATGALTEEQRRLAGVQLGVIEYRPVTSVISCTGEIEVPPQGMASVTAPLGGYIVDTDMVPGAHVKKGALLAKLSNPEYIVLQQSYLETAGQLKFAEQDFERQRMLVEQNAAAVKKLQESESSYKVLKARLAGLAGQLRMIGVDLNNLEKGNIQTEISLRAPLSGFVTEVNHHQGQFVEPREVIFHIVNPRDLHLHLNVFEKDVASIKPGQAVRFRRAGGDGGTYLGGVLLISPQRNADVRTFDVHAHIENEDDRLKPGMYVEAEILLSSDSVHSVAESALVKNGSKAYVVTANEGDYQKVEVATGVSMDGWVEIRNYDELLDKKIVMRGASRIFAALNE